MFTKKIDVAFVDKNFKVIKIVKRMPPWHVESCKDASFVIERFSTNKEFLHLGEKVDF